jgi:hypothetical protein
MNHSRQTFVFKVTLRHVKPAIWRRIEVPATYTFWDLHVAIQDAMGWLDYHLHQFRLRDRSTGALAEVGIPDPDEPLLGRRALPSWEVPLTGYLQYPDLQIDYTYDFGDNWEHRVVLESRGIRDDQLTYPRCLAGARACPPDDCGGYPGYDELLRAIANPEHPRADELRDWVDRSFNPATFDAARVRFADPKARWYTAFGNRQR